MRPGALNSLNQRSRLRDQLLAQAKARRQMLAPPAPSPHLTPTQPSPSYISPSATTSADSTCSSTSTTFQKRKCTEGGVARAEELARWRAQQLAMELEADEASQSACAAADAMVNEAVAVPATESPQIIVKTSTRDLDECEPCGLPVDLSGYQCELGPSEATSTTSATAAAEAPTAAAVTRSEVAARDGKVAMTPSAAASHVAPAAAQTKPEGVNTQAGGAASRPAADSLAGPAEPCAVNSHSRTESSVVGLTEAEVCAAPAKAVSAVAAEQVSDAMARPLPNSPLIAEAASSASAVKSTGLAKAEHVSAVATPITEEMAVHAQDEPEGAAAVAGMSGVAAPQQEGRPGAAGAAAVVVEPPPPCAEIARDLAREVSALAQAEPTPSSKRTLGQSPPAESSSQKRAETYTERSRETRVETSDASKAAWAADAVLQLVAEGGCTSEYALEHIHLPRVLRLSAMRAQALGGLILGRGTESELQFRAAESRTLCQTAIAKSTHGVSLARPRLSSMHGAEHHACLALGLLPNLKCSLPL